MNTTNHMKKTLLSALALALFLTAVPGDVRAAEGDPIWSINPISLFPPFLCFIPSFYTDVANTNNVIVGTCTDVFAANNSPVVGIDPATGSPIWSVTPPLTISAFAADSTGFYVGGGIPWSGAYREVIEKRSLIGGALIWSKSGPNCNAGSCPGRYYNMIVPDGSGSVYATYPSGAGSVGDPGGKLYKLNAATGNEIWSVKSSLYDASFHALVVDSGGIYVGGSYNNTGYLYTGDPRDYFYQKFNPATGASIWMKNEALSTTRDVWSLGLVGGNLYATIINWVASTTFVTETRKADVATGNTVDSYADNDFFVKSDAGGSYSGRFHDFFNSVPPVYKKRNTGDMSVAWSAPVRGYFQNSMVDGSTRWRTAHRMTDFYGLTATTMERRSLSDGSLLWSKAISSDPYNLSALTYDGTYLYGLFGNSGFGFTYQKMNTDPVYCGSANGVPTSIAPTPSPALPPNNLCSSGTAPMVTDTGASFTWTCDGLDGLDATADDVACSAQKPSVLSLCTISGIPVAVASVIPYSRSLLVGSSESFNVFYDATPNVCGDSAPVTDSTWIDDLGAPIVSLAGASTSPQTVTASLVGNERVEIVKESDRILLDYTVGMSCVSSCTPARRTQECSGVTFPETDSCGVAETCAGTRYCDFNWKEVAPGE